MRQERRRTKISAAIFSAAVVLSCAPVFADSHHDMHSGHEAPVAKGPFTRAIDKSLVERGRTVYLTNCAQCHGKEGEGDTHWRHRGSDGKFPPPPLDGSGHAWHHPLADLREMILEGSRPGEGNMPGWKGKLSDDDIGAVIAWFQSLWNDDVFEAWHQIDSRARSDKP